ncbi:hypothetical protein [Yersinia phage fHe-Yen9-04]|uniref:Uncharacterized protein n=1 Tax=Yersinia phage fHe-Yen9-04 TaxID=2052742 RepID=A0A2C9CZ66_9CAUD|nr:hypothetical protein FDJ41_gp512 [Yersinia phage fHe-Yen9-04]SOK58668.1 hypothetical protein [Yersinia phage fHe-Yen9-04]VUE36437.1 hypothetical protein [Yersinia phage fHe-Yen9-04]
MNNENLKDDLSSEFSAYIAELSITDDIKHSKIYIYWHYMVGEYCIEINNKWSGYVPEEFIFKSGFDNYIRWSKYWEKYRTDECFMGLYRKFAQSFDKFFLLDHSNDSELDGHMNMFLYIINTNSIPIEYRKMILSRVIEVLTERMYYNYAEIVKSALEELDGIQENIRRSKKV